MVEDKTEVDACTSLHRRVLELLGLLSMIGNIEFGGPENSSLLLD